MLFIKTEVQSSKKKFYNKDIIINKKYVFFKIDKNIPSNQIVGNVIEF